MQEFIITNIEHRMEPIPYNMRDPFSRPAYASSSCADPYMSQYEVRHGFEMTLRSIDIDMESMRKIGIIHQAGRKVAIQDTEYMDYVKPFKNEFIEFMMEKHPDKIISDPEGWGKLLGRR